MSALTCPTGQYAVLMGRTGAGKTTLLEALCGLKAVAGGTIRLNGRDVTRLKPAERGIGYVPQDRALFQTMTVREHLAFALTIRKAGRQVIQQRVAELSRLAGHRAFAGSQAARLERRRSATRGAGPRPLGPARHPLPGRALERAGRRDAAGDVQLARQRASDTGVTILHVTHNLDEAEQLADRIFQLRDGSVDRRK